MAREQVFSNAISLIPNGTISLSSEAVARASMEAEANDEDEVLPEHIEAIMATLLLDF